LYTDVIELRRVRTPALSDFLFHLFFFFRETSGRPDISSNARTDVNRWERDLGCESVGRELSSLDSAATFYLQFLDNTCVNTSPEDGLRVRPKHVVVRLSCVNASRLHYTQRTADAVQDNIPIRGQLN